MEKDNSNMYIDISAKNIKTMLLDLIKTAAQDFLSYPQDFEK